MIKKIIYTLVVAVLLLPFIPVTVMAAYADVTGTDSTAVIYLSDTGGNYTISSNIEVESFIVNAGTVVVSMPAGANIKLTSANRHRFTFTDAASCSTDFTCEEGQSWAEVKCDAATTQTVTITVSATACVVPTTGGSSGSYTPPTPPPAPAVTTPAPVASVVIPIVVATPPLVAAPVSYTPVMEEETTPASPIQFSNIAATSYQPGESLKFSYQYENTNETTAKVKLVRQLVNSKGKVVKQSTASATVKPGSLYVKNISEAMDKKLPPGEYTVKIKTLDAKTNRVLDENSFGIEVEKLKKKMFVFGEVSNVDSAIGFDAKALTKIKSNVAMPSSLKLTYSYVNNMDVKQDVKMMRELINEHGAVVSAAKPGSWSLKAGKKYAAAITQSLAGNLPAGDYTIRIRAYDKKTNELLAENSLGFSIELK